MRLFAIFFLFLLFSAFLIVSNENLQLSKPDEFMQFGRLYYSWLDGLFENVKSLTGSVIQQHWLPPLNLTG
ncbi:hypothetical protein HYZ97_04595 [Candidatus Pacearchaeota archaeon]|nr:hypothetical protein [Candidatus Pacearchaeota archaeon]